MNQPSNFLFTGKGKSKVSVVEKEAMLFYTAVTHTWNTTKQMSIVSDLRCGMTSSLFQEEIISSWRSIKNSESLSKLVTKKPPALTFYVVALELNGIKVMVTWCLCFYLFIFSLDKQIKTISTTAKLSIAKLSGKGWRPFVYVFKVSR